MIDIFKKLSKKPTNYFTLIILILLGVGVGFLVYLSLIFTAINIDELNSLFPFISTSKGATLTLVSEKQEYKVGDLVNLKILLGTKQGKTQGVDIALYYDPKVLVPLTADGKSVNLSKDGGSQRLNPANMINSQESAFEIFPNFSVDTNKGLIRFSALAKPLQELAGNVLVASLNFKALAQGETSLGLSFLRGATNDSNVAYLGKDILKGVKNLSITIK